jgi:hypothetical protein
VALTRDELGVRMIEAGIEAKGLRLAYLVGHAELEALICSGPRRGKRQTYALVDERIPPAPARTREEALAELARRYVEGHGPAQAADLAWWSGLTVADARTRWTRRPRRSSAKRTGSGRSGSHPRRQCLGSTAPSSTCSRITTSC